MRLQRLAILAVLLLSACTRQIEFEVPDTSGMVWFKGNTHTHTTRSDGDATVKRALAAFIVLSIVGLALPAGRRLGKLFADRVWWGALWGFLSGWFQGAYSTGGPPAVIFIMASDPEPRRAMGFLGGFFTLLYAIMFAIHISSGLFTLQVLRDCAVYAPAVALGALAGTLLFRRASNTTYRWAVQGLLLLTALLLWIGS